MIQILLIHRFYHFQPLLSTCLFDQAFSWIFQEGKRDQKTLIFLGSRLTGKIAGKKYSYVQ